MKGIPGGKNKGKNVSKPQGDSPAHNVPGGPGKSFAQKPIPGPVSPGQPIAMKKALARKPGTGKGI